MITLLKNFIGQFYLSKSVWFKKHARTQKYATGCTITTKKPSY